MGVNNRQRRAAKQKQRARQRPRSSSDRGGEPGVDDHAAWQAYALVDQQVRAAVRGLVGRRVDADELRAHTSILLRRVGAGSTEVVGGVLAEVLVEILDGTVAGGWDPSDLAELVRRREESWLPLLAAALHEHSLGDGPADAGWRAAVAAIAPVGRLLLTGPEDLATGLGLTSVLAGVPVLDEAQFAASARSRAEPAEHPKWHQARALLAKAESTDFGPEAEALVAKAQELISRYSLERLLESHAGGTPGGSGRGPVPRRMWLDRPYVRAKGALVAEVAQANHCRAALAEDAGFALLVGHESDLGAVELLVTSLLAQADVAMLRRGRSDGRAGSRARSRSFRQSFLTAFAHRIGERLGEAADAAVAGRAGALPVLRDHEARVSETFDAMVPHTRGRAVTVSDYAGWEAGTLAADLAMLDVDGRMVRDAHTG